MMPGITAVIFGPLYRLMSLCVVHSDRVLGKPGRIQQFPVFGRNDIADPVVPALIYVPLMRFAICQMSGCSVLFREYE